MQALFNQSAVNSDVAEDNSNLAMKHSGLSSWASNGENDIDYSRELSYPTEDSSSGEDNGSQMGDGIRNELFNTDISKTVWDPRQPMIRRHISKKYYVTSDSLRYKLLKLLDSNNITIKKAAEVLKINYSTAKSIVQIYKREGRICKKTINSRLSTPLSVILQKYEEDPNYRGHHDEYESSELMVAAVVAEEVISDVQSETDSTCAKGIKRRYTTHEDELAEEVVTTTRTVDVENVQMTSQTDDASQKLLDLTCHHQGEASNLMEGYVNQFFNPDLLVMSRYLPVPSALQGIDLRTLEIAAEDSMESKKEF